MEKVNVNIIRVGVIICEQLYYDKITNRCRFAIVLVKNTKWSTYMDFGGTREKNEKPLNTMMREVQEESCNMIYISDSSVIRTVDDQGNKLYIDNKNNKRNQINSINREYIMCYKSNVIDHHIYNKNKQIIENATMSNSWNETVEIKRFFIGDIILGLVINKRDEHNDLLCKASDGSDNYIFHETAEMIHNFINYNEKTNIFGFIQNNPVNVVRKVVYMDDKNKSSKFKFLNGTTMLVI